MEEEAAALTGDLPVLITGPGKVNAAVSVTAALSSASPASVINLGTAGGLHDGLAGIHQVHAVIQHDFDAAAIRALVQRDYGTPIELAADAGARRIVLATGDAFISDAGVRRQLAAEAHLVDMEGYAVAWAARAAGARVRPVKLVSDSADDGAKRTWAQTVGQHAEALAEWVVREFGAFGQDFSNT